MGKRIITAEARGGKHFIDLIRNPEEVYAAVCSLILQKFHGFFHLFCRCILMQVYAKCNRNLMAAVQIRLETIRVPGVHKFKLAQITSVLKTISHDAA